MEDHQLPIINIEDDEINDLSVMNPSTPVKQSRTTDNSTPTKTTLSSTPTKTTYSTPVKNRQQEQPEVPISPVKFNDETDWEIYDVTDWDLRGITSENMLEINGARSELLGFHGRVNDSLVHQSLFEGKDSRLLIELW